MELNSRKEFLEDYVFTEAEKGRKEQELYRKLCERNRTINQQINSHVRKSAHCLPVPLIIIPPPRSSGDEKSSEPLSHKPSLRASFLISKRKTSFHQDSSSNN